MLLSHSCIFAGSFRITKSLIYNSILSTYHSDTILIRNCILSSLWKNKGAEENFGIKIAYFIFKKHKILLFKLTYTIIPIHYYRTAPLKGDPLVFFSNCDIFLLYTEQYFLLFQFANMLSNTSPTYFNYFLVVAFFYTWTVFFDNLIFMQQCPVKTVFTWDQLKFVMINISNL